MWPHAYRTNQIKKKKTKEQGANVKFCNYFLAAVILTASTLFLAL